MTLVPFEIGRLYNRRHDLHAEYGGQLQSGISTPKGRPFILAFTGKSGARHGYADYETPEGTFCLYGEGQNGDMQFTKGNRAIRDHVADGKDIFLFEAAKKKGEVRFKGVNGGLIPGQRGGVKAGQWG